ncbi:hypothetical protein CY0110_18627 [Crocosphaera chwakensis CCY0110]|uniref:Uncharacterized protein n=1 Tax=Crocosphaera chwakensis CCY0110 TaxID=391612 RepID=A3IJ57_9CHRO|nr:hypothetical protein CY0110_18627 [Crocosphaera chwakensis CCY0110]
MFLFFVIIYPLNLLLTSDLS